MSISVAAGEWFPINLTRLMAERGLNDPRLAYLLGVSRQAVNLWRKGEGKPDDAHFAALCVALNCSKANLVGKPPPATNKPAMLPITVWARREKIPVGRARDLFSLRLLTGEEQTPFTTMVPEHLHAPKDSRMQVLMAKRRPRWVPTFHANFARLVAETNTSFLAISDATGVQPSAVQHWMRQRNYPARERIPLIAEVLGVSVQELVGHI